MRRRRGSFSAARAVSYGVGTALLLGAAAVPDETFAGHMCRHLLLGDLAPLFVVLGLDGPLLRPALALRPVRALRVLAHPLVALPLWAVDLCVWHVAPLFDAAIRHDALHALQHLLFFACGALLWSALLELLPGPRWFGPAHRLAYLGVMWLVSLGLSQVLLWSPRPYYHGSVTDQRIGGGIMLLESSVVMLSVGVWIVLRLLGSDEYRGAAPARS